MKHHPNPPPVRFVVVSLLEPSGVLRPHLVQCPACGVVHRVTEVGVSHPLPGGRSYSAGILSLDEVKENLPEKMKDLLEKNEVQPEVVYEVGLVFEHELWGRTVILTKEETTPGFWSGKKVFIISRSLWQVTSWSRDDSA